MPLKQRKQPLFADCGCSHSTSASQNWAVLPKPEDNIAFFLAANENSNQPIFGTKLEVREHKMFHVFHFLQSDMVFGIVNPCSWIFNAVSREKSCLISMPLLLPYIDFRKVKIFPSAECLISQLKCPACQPYARRNRTICMQNHATLSSWLTWPWCGSRARSPTTKNHVEQTTPI